jgi:glycosyltransferase involved in cell wall biosynthesis
MEFSDEFEKYRSELKSMGICVIIPTYNNQKTVKRVIESVLQYTSDVIVVNDGATDDTAQILKTLENQVTLTGYLVNKGKGYALKTGFKKAIEIGFIHAITIDSDGQHFADDIPKFIDAHKKNPEAVVMGARDLEAEGMPGKNSFANRFSNFWFFVETGHRLPDTQTGFRLYPLKMVDKLWLFTTRFEFEIEVIVKLAWRDLPFISVPIKVTYDPNERVTHFRPGPDFTRISLLNTWLCILTLLYHLPRRLLKGGKIFKLIKDEAIKPNETNVRKAASIGFGVFMGIVPVWGFQLIIGIPAAVFMRLNKVLFIAAANISLPPMIPVLIFLSYLLGEPFIDADPIRLNNLDNINLESVRLNFVQYAIGAVILAISGGITAFLASLGAFSVSRKSPEAP